MPSVLYKQSQVTIKYLRKLLDGKIFDNLKNGFMLDVQTESLTDFTENVVFRVWDSQKEATVCLDYDLKEQAIAKPKGMEGIFICLEQALNTTKKWNLHVEFGERLVAF